MTIQSDRPGVDLTKHTPSADDDQALPAEVVEDDALQGVVVGRDLPALLPPWATSWEILRANADLRARRAGHHLFFYGLRSPKYTFRLVVRGVVGTARGARLVFRWVFDRDAAPLRQHAIAKREVKEYLDLQADRNALVRVRGIIAGGTALAAVIAAGAELHYVPSALAVEGLLALGVAAWHGGPEDDPGLFDTPDLPVRLDLSAEHLNAAFRAVGLLKGKDDDDDAMRLVMVQQPMKDARGWSAIIDMPRGSGKSAGDVLKLRDRIAAELGVDEIQLDMRRVRVARQGNAARIALWVCDGDPYLQDAPTPSPLGILDRFDLWNPIPFGRDARGNRVLLSIIWQSMFFGGLPRRGKTAAQRILSAAGALDPGVRHWVADGKGGSDWLPMKRIAHRFVLGAETEAVYALENMLDEIIVEMEAAYKKIGSIPLVLLPDGKLTPGVAARYGLHLHLVTIDELQEYLSTITDTKRKDALIEKLARIARRGPGAGFISNFASQRPDADSVPTKLREIVTYRYCTQVIDKTSSDMVLGKEKAKQGADASILSEEHVGVGVLVTGPTNFTTVLTDYIDVPAFAEISERGRELRIEAGALTGDADDDVLSGEVDNVIPQILADSLTVMRHVTRIWTSDLMNHLVNLSEQDYGAWTPERLAEELRNAGVARSTNQVKIGGGNRNGYWKSDLEAAALMYERRS